MLGVRERHVQSTYSGGIDLSTEQWQGYLFESFDGGVALQSPFGLNGHRVFGPDSDYTTLAISALELLQSNGQEITSCRCTEELDAQAIFAATGVSCSEDAEWYFLVADEALVVCTNQYINEISDLPLIVEVDEQFHTAISKAWEHECSPQNISQGAYVSKAQYEESIHARLGMQGQFAESTVIWPPRQRTDAGEIVPSSSNSNVGRRGKIQSWTTLSAAGAPSEFALRAPILGGLTSILVKLETNPSGVFLMVDDEEPKLDFDLDVELVVRRIYAQDGFIRYGRKARVMFD
jgi:uncharacterized OB-fold protein